VSTGSFTYRDLRLSRAAVCVDGELDLSNVAEFKAEVWSALGRTRR
jgi:hypothetical protein